MDPPHPRRHGDSDARGSVSRTCAILCHAKQAKEVHRQFEDVAAEDSVPEPATASTPAPVIQAPVAISSISTAAVASIKDALVKSVEISTVIIAQKLKEPANEVPVSKSIKDFVGRKSTLQNEILGDLGQEFGSALEKGEELPVEELGAALGVGFSRNVDEYATRSVSRLIDGKMLSGFSPNATKPYLPKSWGSVLNVQVVFSSSVLLRSL